MTAGIFSADLDPRNPDGKGNNELNLNWGAADVYVRVTANSYADGLSQMEIGPAPRAISNVILAQPRVNGIDVDLPSAAELNEFFQFFGQFITHDITEAAAGDRRVAAEVLTPRPDGLPPGFDFVRTDFTTNGGVRQQFSVETSFLDLSMVYGANTTMLDLLRVGLVGGGQSAKLLTSAANVLPSFQDVANDSGKTTAFVFSENGGTTALGGNAPTLLVSGDDRTNQSASLITHHTIWVREHNYQVDRLSAKFPSWTQDQLFEAARAVTEAEWQHVVYSEYLTKLLGENALQAYDGYKSTVNPSVINEWATVAFRFGHDQSSNVFNILEENGSVSGSFTLADAFNLANASDAIRNSGSLDQWVRGQLSHQTQEIDGKIVDGNRNLLFGGATTDLNVLDIQRGRDHGVGDYNTLRDGLRLAKYASFQDFAADNNLDAATLQALIDVYVTIDKLDSLVGGLLEKHAPGSQLGVTFTRLTVMQFQNLRDGDRFYYENRFKNDPDFINDIKSTSLADIIGRNTGIQYMYHDAFASHQRIGGTGSDDTLTGTAKKDLITGYAGDDIANGGTGDDDLFGGEGHDHLRGQGGADRLAGEAGNDTLEGGAGADRLTGGDGGDTASYVGSAAVAINLQAKSASGGDADGDVLISVENLIGSSGADTLTGDSSANQLSGGAGNDTLNGGAGADVLRGGDGDDVYVVDDVADVVSDTSGYDTVLTSVSYALGANSGIEALTYSGAGAVNLTGDEAANILTGGAGNDALFGAGGNDTLNGNDGNDYLDGGAGADIMRGGAGDDVYLVDDVLDVVSDSSGSDTVYATVNYTLAADSGIDALVILGGNPVSLVGNESANTLIGGGGADRLDGLSGNDGLYGGAGNDRLYGGKGSDTLVGDSGNDWLYGGSEKDTMIGGIGNDVFVFNTKPNKKTNFDKISDFNVRNDSIALDNAVFKKIGKGSESKIGKLNKSFFEVGAKADDSNDYVIYNKKTGVLYYDSDGSGKTKAVEIAQLKKDLKMTYHDFLII